jgi:hypothetical protein
MKQKKTGFDIFTVEAVLIIIAMLGSILFIIFR